MKDQNYKRKLARDGSGLDDGNDESDDGNSDDDNDNARHVMGASEAAVRATTAISVLGMSDRSLQHASSVSGTSGCGREPRPSAASGERGRGAERATRPKSTARWRGAMSRAGSYRSVAFFRLRPFDF